LITPQIGGNCIAMNNQWWNLLLLVLPGFIWAQPSYNLSELSLPLSRGSNEVLWYEDRYVEVLGPGEIELTRTYAVTLLNDKSEAAEQTIFYATETAKVLEAEARIYDRRGKEIRKVKKKEMRDVLPSALSREVDDNRVLIASLPYHEYPYTVEVQYRMRISGPGMLQAYNWFLLDRTQRSLRWARYQLEVPADWEISFLPLNLDMEQEEKRIGNNKLYQFTAERIPAIPAEYSSPPIASMLPMLYVFPDRFEIDGYTGSMKSWTSYGKFMNQLLTDRQEIPAALAKEVEQVVAGAETRWEQVERLYRFMQEEMRYVSIQLGLGGWQPLSIEEVYSNKYGDCKALTNYMHGLLELVGIESNPVLIYRGQAPFSDLHDEYPTIAFNHMLLYVPEEEAFLECTSNDYPAGFIGQSNEGRQALLLTPEGGKVIAMPRTPAMDNRMVHRALVNLNIHGGARVQMEKEVSGLSHEYYRYLKGALGETELKQELKSNLDLPTHTWEDWSLEISREKPQADLTIQMNFLRLGNEAGKRLFLPLNFLNPSPAIPPMDENRVFALERRLGFSEMDTIEFILPPGYGMESYPEQPIRIESEFGSYEAAVELRGGRLWYTRKLVVPPYRVPPEKYQELRRFFLKVQQADRQQCVLVKRA
jgi:hypothetical protein